MAVPIFNDSPIENIPLNKLPSQGDFLHLLWHRVGGDFSGFQGEYQKRDRFNNFFLAKYYLTFHRNCVYLLPCGEVGSNMLLKLSVNEQPLSSCQAQKPMGARRIPSEERPLPT